MANGLTFAEYEQAFLAFADCAKQAGWSFESEPVLAARQNYDFRMVLPGANGPGLDQLSLNALEDCRVAYFDSVQQQWAMQTPMSEQERQQARDWLGSCTRERGVDVPTHPSASDWTPFIVVSSGMSIAHAQLPLSSGCHQERFRDRAASGRRENSESPPQPV
ncbi:MAG: hypothetical protein ACM3S1_07185 [Hyphomicrobiales bacterium]